MSVNLVWWEHHSTSSRPGWKNAFHTKSVKARYAFRLDRFRITGKRSLWGVVKLSKPSLANINNQNVKAISQILNVKPQEVKSFFRNQLSPTKTQSLRGQMKAAGIPV